MKVAYEVNAVPRRDLREKFARYMNEAHIPEMMKTGYFLSAAMTERSAGEFKIRYVAKDRDTLESYFENCAPALREDFVRHFPEGVALGREVLDIES